MSGSANRRHRCDRGKVSLTIAGTRAALAFVPFGFLLGACEHRIAGTPEQPPVEDVGPTVPDPGSIERTILSTRLGELASTLADASAWTGEPSPVTDDTRIAPEIPVGVRRFPVGVRHEYLVSLDSSGDVALAPLADQLEDSADQSLEAVRQGLDWTMSFRGRAIFENVAPRRLAGKLVIDHVDMQTMVQGQVQAADGDSLARLEYMLSLPFELELSARGSFDQLRISDKLQPDAVEVLTNILQALSAGLPEDGLRRAWLQGEAETSGTAGYAYMADTNENGDVHLKKLRLAEQTLRMFEDGVAQELDTVTELEGGRAIALDREGGLFAAQRMQETVKYTIPDKGAKASLSTRGHAVRVATGAALGDIPTPEGPQLAFGNGLPSGATATETAPPGEGSDFRDAVDELQALPEQALDELEIFRRVGDLRNRLTHRGAPPAEDVVAALESLRSSRVRGVVLDAMALSGRADLMPELARRIEDQRASAEDRERVALSLLHAQKPSRRLAAALHALAESEDRALVATGLSVLGAVIGRLKDVDPEAADAEVTWLEHGLARAGDAQMKLYWVTALGNTRMSRIYATVRPFAGDGPTALRVRAVSALRFVDRDEVDPELVGWLVDDGDVAVRDAAAEILSFRKSPKALPVFAQVLESAEQPKSLKVSIMARLAPFLDDPRARAMLERAKEHDVDMQVREQAGKVLEGWLNANGKAR